MNPLTKHGINIIITPKQQQKQCHQAQIHEQLTILEKLQLQNMANEQKKENDTNSNSIFKQIAKNWIKGKSNPVVYADVFADDMDAVSLQNEINEDDDIQTERGKLTIIAGDENESDWYKLQTVVTASTIAKHGVTGWNDTDTLLIIPKGNVYNLCINNLQRNICGGLSKLRFEDDDESGHKPFDWIKRKKHRKKPQPTTEFYLNWYRQQYQDQHILD